jgi:hypothetical protein
MSGRRTLSGLAIYVVVVTGCGVSAQGVAARANATRFYDARLLAPQTATSSDQREPALEVRLATKFAFAPASVQSLIRVSPHPDNRRLRVLIDGELFTRSSDTQLEGADAAKHYFFTWQSLPPGTYSIVATVYGSVGVREQQLSSFEVLGDRESADVGAALRRP